MRRVLLVAFITLISSLSLVGQESDERFDPAKAVDGLQVHDALQVELFASEPVSYTHLTLPTTPYV